MVVKGVHKHPFSEFSLGLLLGLEAPVMTRNGVVFVFFSEFSCMNSQSFMLSDSEMAKFFLRLFACGLSSSEGL